MKQEETRGEGQYHYHYDRSEREVGLSGYAERNLHTSGFLRRNRSLAITLIDLLVLLLLFLLIMFYLKMQPSGSRFEGLEVTSDAYLSEERLFVALTFERTEDSGPTGMVRVLFRVLPDDRRLELIDALPKSMGDSRTMRGVVECSSREPRLFATVDLEERSEVIEIPVRGE